MSLDVYLNEDGREVYSDNITHNLTKMADEAGIYEALWRPDELLATRALQLIPILEAGLRELRDNPEYYEQFNPENGWGNYVGLVRFVADYLEACKQHLDATIEVCR